MKMHLRTFAVLYVTISSNAIGNIWSDVVLPVANFSVSILSLSLNGLILYTFCRYKELRKKDGLYFMTLLAIADSFSAVQTLFSAPYVMWNAISPFNLTVLQCAPIVS